MRSTSYTPVIYFATAVAAVMKSVLIKNIGVLLTGDLKNPVRAADSIYIEDGVIQEIGTAIGRRSEIVVDAGGITAIPGLVDSHSHPTFGEFTPAQNSTTRINHYMHGGVTALISAGELHVPGLPLPPDPRTAPARRRSRPDRQGHRRLPGNLQVGQFTFGSDSKTRHSRNPPD